MKYIKALAFAVIAGATIVTATGCAIARGQETAGAYLDDTAITTSVKTKFVEDKTVDASAISVETLNGTVMMSGFAKSSAEKSQAEKLTRTAKGVKSVKNDLVVRP
jgi:osmotically-inducible protein OsmY